jgi:glycosyltransferase involved in cell wall biosynthesis
MLRTWEHKITRYIVFSNLFKQRLVQNGFPADRIVIKPHFTADPGLGSRSGGYALFAGRLVFDKGVDTLLKAWRNVSGQHLVICGGGPMDEEVHRFAAEHPDSVTLYPFLTKQELEPILKNAAFVVWPSLASETFGLIALEALASGVPVLSSGVSAANDLVVDGKTGINFKAGDPASLAEKMNWVFDHPAELAQMSVQGRQHFLDYYTPEENYRQLIAIYQSAITENAHSGITREG